MSGSRTTAIPCPGRRTLLGRTSRNQPGFWRFMRGRPSRHCRVPEGKGGTPEAPRITYRATRQTVTASCDYTGYEGPDTRPALRHAGRRSNPGEGSSGPSTDDRTPAAHRWQREVKGSDRVARLGRSDSNGDLDCARRASPGDPLDVGPPSRRRCAHRVLRCYARTAWLFWPRVPDVPEMVPTCLPRCLPRTDFIRRGQDVPK